MFLKIVQKNLRPKVTLEASSAFCDPLVSAILRAELRYWLISSATNTSPHTLNSYALTVLIVRVWGHEDW